MHSPMTIIESVRQTLVTLNGERTQLTTSGVICGWPLPTLTS